MFDFLKKIDLLENFSLAEVILHIRLLNGLDCHIFASEFMYTERHFTKRSLPN